jgi:hypothetical protein
MPKGAAPGKALDSQKQREKAEGKTKKAEVSCLLLGLMNMRVN